MKSDPVFLMCDQIRETSFKIHRYLGSGFLEKIYENSLKPRLEKNRFNVCQQVRKKVLDEDAFVLGEHVIDLIVNHLIVVEVKAIKSLEDIHQAQLIGYLKAMNIEHGLLINFGAPKLQIRKFVYS